MTYVFRKTKNHSQHALFTSCQIDIENKQPFSPLSWNNQLNISQKKLDFMRYLLYLFIEHQSGKGSENFLYWHWNYWTCQKADYVSKKDGRFSRANNLKTIKIENTQFTSFCFYMSICVAHFPHLYLCDVKCVPKFSLKWQKKCLSIKTLILFRQASSCNFTNKKILHLSRVGICKTIQRSYLPPNLLPKTTLN